MNRTPRDARPRHHITLRNVGDGDMSEPIAFFATLAAVARIRVVAGDEFLVEVNETRPIGLSGPFLICFAELARNSCADPENGCVLADGFVKV